MEARLTRNDVVSRAKALKNSAAFVPVAEMASLWLQIFSAIALFYLYRSWWVYIPVILFISARQYALGIMLHDAQHTLLHRDKSINQMLGKWLLAAPLGAAFVESQKSHLDHHLHFGSVERDPDYAIYCFGDPSRKQTISQIARMIVSKLNGEKILYLAKRVADGDGRTGSPDKPSLPIRLIGSVRRLWTVIVVQALIFGALTYLFGWYGYFALWFFPLASLAALYNDFRIFCEHSLIGRDSSNTDDRMVTFVSNPIERFFVAPNHMNYHAEHHFFPYVPHRNLPALREAIRQCPEWNDRIEWRSSYFGHLRAYIKGFKKTREERALFDHREKIDTRSATHRL
jgi:fatty acid desaturase